MQYYTSPVSGYTFTSKMETIEYLFSGMEERMLESQERTEDNELHVSQFFCSHAMFYAAVELTDMCSPDFCMQGSHTWLPGGWLIEVRASGKKMNKMYKVGDVPHCCYLWMIRQVMISISPRWTYM